MEVLVIKVWKDFCLICLQECILYLGKAKLELKDYKNALSDFKKYKEIDPSDDVDKLIRTCEENLTSD